MTNAGLRALLAQEQEARDACSRLFAYSAAVRVALHNEAGRLLDDSDALAAAQARIAEMEAAASWGGMQFHGPEGPR